MNKYLFDAFISYNYKDRDFATRLLTDLEALGLRISIDYRDFEIGIPVISNLERIVENSRHTILILSPDWVKSEWTSLEAIFLQIRDPIGQKKKLMPILYKPCELPLRLKIFTYLDFTKDYKKALTHLIKSLGLKDDVNRVEFVDTKYQENNEILKEVLSLNRQMLELLLKGNFQTSRKPSKIFREFGSQEDSQLCFILMPFGPHWSRKFFDNHISPTCKKLNMSSLRADDIYGISGIMEDVWLYINRARIIIADLTTRNPNVFYEVGLAHAIGKDVILMTQTLNDVPFDLRGVRCIEYSLELDGPKNFEKDLEQTIVSILEDDKNKI